MIEWKPIETALGYLKDQGCLLEKNRSGISTWGPAWVWSAKEGLMQAEYVEWETDAKTSHWRNVETNYDGDHDTVKPTHWAILNFPANGG